MDPSLFRIDWEVLAEVLMTIIVLSFFIERALSLLFEHRIYVRRFAEAGLKEPIAFFVSFAVVRYWQFDALSILLRSDTNSLWGYIITGAIIAGGVSEYLTSPTTVPARVASLPISKQTLSRFAARPYLSISLASSHDRK